MYEKKTATSKQATFLRTTLYCVEKRKQKRKDNTHESFALCL